MQYLPVAPLSPVLVHAERELEAHEAEAPVVASLVRSRLQLDRARGWMLLSGIVVTAAAVVGLGACVESKLVLGVLAPVVASLPFVLSLATERACRGWFMHGARSHGLSLKASRKIYDGALGADHWMGVLVACGRPPTDSEIKAFVAHRPS